MKVTNDLVSLVEQYQAKPASNTVNEAGRSFGDALADELQGAPANVTAAGRPDIVEYVVGGGEGEIPSEWYQINDVVDSLDRYSEALGDPVYTLKDLEPLAADMEKQAQSLYSKLQEGGFGSLREVAEEAVAQAQVAAIKFRRGDYV
jgi:hypothetical protein